MQRLPSKEDLRLFLNSSGETNNRWKRPQATIIFTEVKSKGRASLTGGTEFLVTCSFRQVWAVTSKTG